MCVAPLAINFWAKLAQCSLEANWRLTTPDTLLVDDWHATGELEIRAIYCKYTSCPPVQNNPGDAVVSIDPGVFLCNQCWLSIPIPVAHLRSRQSLRTASFELVHGYVLVFKHLNLPDGEPRWDVLVHGATHIGIEFIGGVHFAEFRRRLRSQYEAEIHPG
ncbi:hypothetical protein B0H12DRAFT_1081219 [Mycena haematopus]|nr:hypothetical protein B0H12DRAFT_1081219 [Mycena haematopus]